ncbi:MAG: hypothetical protein ACE5HV_08235 [Acidobacteriota bacterium]
MSNSAAFHPSNRRQSTAGTLRISPWHFRLLWLLLAVGVVAFAVGVFSTAPLRAWQAYLINFLFFTAIAQSGAVFLAILVLTRSRWGRPFQRLAEGMVAFLPISFLLFLLLPFGRTVLFPWVTHPIPEKALWLNFTFLVVRDGVGLLLLFALSLALVYQSLRPQAWLLRGRVGGWAEDIYTLLTHNFRGLEMERERSRGRIGALAVGLVAVFALVFSLLAGDLVMSLSPHWYSSLFGAYNFIVALYLGLAALAIIAVWARRAFGLQQSITADHLHDLGKLIFAFCMVGGDFFWSQFLVIWYGNIPEETSFLIQRIHDQPWLALSWSVLTLAFVVPFVLLLARAPKRTPWMLTSIASLIVASLWAERYLLIVPSLMEPAEATFGLLEVTITLGFLAAFGLVYLAFLKAFPPVDEAIAAEEAEPVPSIA